jgi:hypothetical protein
MDETTDLGLSAVKKGSHGPPALDGVYVKWVTCRVRFCGSTWRPRSA